MSVKSIIKLNNKSLANQQIIIPSVPGEFYSYEYSFTKNEPLYFLLKCKSNKGYSINTDLQIIKKQLDLTLIFDKKITLNSPNTESSLKLLHKYKLNFSDLNNTKIKLPHLSKEKFYEIFNAKNGLILKKIFEESDNNQSEIILLKDLIISIKTDSGKYGLMLIKKLTENICTVDACHILILK